MKKNIAIKFFVFLLYSRGRKTFQFCSEIKRNLVFREDSLCFIYNFQDLIYDQTFMKLPNLWLQIIYYRPTCCIENKYFQFLHFKLYKIECPLQKIHELYEKKFLIDIEN